MKTRNFLLPALVLCALGMVLNASATAGRITSQNKTDKPQVSAAETAAVKAIETAADINAKFVAAADFVKKYPKSGARQQLAEYMADQIFGVKDPNEELAAAQKFATIFTEPSEVNAGKPALIDAHINLKRFDDAFSTGATYLANNADDISVLIQLTIAGADQAKQENAKFLGASRQYGAKAIELIEADKKPAKMDALFWGKQKALLPQLYQSMGFISIVEQKPAEAQAKLEKAAQLNPADPFNYYLLSIITYDEYQKEALAHKNMVDSKAKDEQLQKATALLDKVIDQYAHVVGLAAGKPQYQKLHDQLLEDLQAYYKYRHKNSTEGLQKLIDGYKLP